MIYTQDITGIVLAGGLSSRMGQDKSLMLFNGKALVSHAIDTLSFVCGKVIISSNNPVYDFTGCEVWPDELPVQAPLIGLYSCLKRSLTDWNILLSCDMPLVDSRLFKFLLQHALNYETVIPVHLNGFVEPLCGLYNRSVLAKIEDHIDKQEYSMLKLAGATRCRLVNIGSQQPFYKDTMFSNINSPADFDLLSLG